MDPEFRIGVYTGLSNTFSCISEGLHIKMSWFIEIIPDSKFVKRKAGGRGGS